MWNGIVIAESDDVVIVEGNHYFPLDAVKSEYLRPSETTSNCPWKGVASYHHVAVNGDVLSDAAWFYPETEEAAESIRGRIAFWKGVEVEA